MLGSGMLTACGGDSIDSSARFADGFVWGVATAAPQIESRDGRGQSNWDVFADQPGTIAASPDFLGVQHYNCFYVKAGANGTGFALAASPQNEIQTMAYPVEPYGISEMLLRVHNDYGAPRIIVTETGFAIKEPAPSGGIVDDGPRIDYLASYLNAAHDAYRQGVRLGGVFYWAGLDSWEWGSGFAKKFGLVHVDPNTQQRVPKRRLAYYSRCIAGNYVA
ncbi:TPA: family 1 glycosylhydrolase [Burkholderia cepacia]|nr:hypothetical protein BZY94_32005 [Burkholderia territorii]HDR9502977.1 family 1 glycosylhydrolase [Burkholderia cepacia]